MKKKLWPDNLMGFGKYKNKTLSWVQDNNPQYILWMQTEDMNYEIPKNIINECVKKVFGISVYVGKKVQWLNLQLDWDKVNGKGKRGCGKVTYPYTFTIQEMEFKSNKDKVWISVLDENGYGWVIDKNHKPKTVSQEESIKVLESFEGYKVGDKLTVTSNKNLLGSVQGFYAGKTIVIEGFCTLGKRDYVYISNSHNKRINFSPKRFIKTNSNFSTESKDSKPLNNEVHQSITTVARGNHPEAFVIPCSKKARSFQSSTDRKPYQATRARSRRIRFAPLN